MSDGGQESTGAPEGNRHKEGIYGCAQSVGDAEKEALEKFFQGMERAAVRAELQANPPV